MTIDALLIQLIENLLSAEGAANHHKEALVAELNKYDEGQHLLAIQGSVHERLIAASSYTKECEETTRRLMPAFLQRLNDFESTEADEGELHQPPRVVKRSEGSEEDTPRRKRTASIALYPEPKGSGQIADSLTNQVDERGIVFGRKEQGLHQPPDQASVKSADNVGQVGNPKAAAGEAGAGDALGSASGSAASVNGVAEDERTELARVEQASSSEATSDAEHGQRDRDSDQLFQECYERNAPLLRRYVSRLTQNRVDADGFVAEVFGEVWQQFVAGDGEALSRAHLVAVAKKSVNAWMRREAALQEIAKQAEDSLAHEDTGQPDDLGVYVEYVRRFVAALGELPYSDARLAYSYYVLNRTFSETAAESGIPESAAYIRLHRARTKLAKLLQAKRGTTLNGKKNF